MRQVRLGRVLLLLLVAFAAAAGAASPAAAFSPATQRAIAQEAARLAPPDLARQMERHRKELAAGAAAPFRDGDPGRHVKNADGSGQLDRVIAAEVERAVEMIRAHRPFAEVVRQLGVVSHFVADANSPLNASAADPREASYFSDYLHYVEAALPRFPLVFYGLDPRLDGDCGLGAFVARTLERSRRLYPLIGEEYRRVSFLPGAEAFDDRSTAFGVSSLAFSYAVNDVARVLRHAWLAAGGADERRGLVLAADRRLRLPRATAGR